ncbi:MAG: imelysin family protein [Arachidicoccus sp.]|nr:imelysin family protein [Arachidicoccus sp.]
MKKKILFITAIAIIGLSSCSKDDNSSNENISDVSTQALKDFVNVLGEPLYADFVTKATALNDAVVALVANPTAANQTAAQNAWVATRVIWEQSEGFLIGPVEDDNYDPNMDTWPTDKNSIDSMLNKNPNMDDSFLDNVDDALKGFHPLEYYLWDFKPETYTDAQKNYMTALAANILDNTKALEASWTTGGYGNEIINAGQSSSSFTSKENALETIANSLIDICSEVGESKMPEPFNAQDSTLTESPYSHNSVADFKNNIQGAFNSYKCSYNGTTGKSLSDIVQINNKSLDNKIRQAFTNAISSFSALDNTTFELAIYNSRSAVQNIIDQIETLQTLLSNELIPYVQQYIKD